MCLNLKILNPHLSLFVFAVLDLLISESKVL